MVESVARGEKDRDADRDKEKSREKDRSRDKDKDSREKDKDKSRDKERDSRDSRDKERDRDKDRDKERDKERDKDKDRKHKSRSKEGERDDKSKSEKEREKEREHRERSKDKESKDKDRDRKDKTTRDKEKERERERDKEREKERERDKEKERERERDREKEKIHEKDRDVPMREAKEEEEEEEGEFNSGGGAEISLSVDETNALRAKLGLAPLQIDTGPSAEELAKQQEEREQMEKDMKTVELAGKIEKLKNKRLLTAKMAGKSIAEEATEEDDNPLAWIEKSRKLEAEKAKAAERARMMDELDEEQEEVAEKLPVYSEKQLAGMKIAHNVDQFGENEEILVLKDTYIVGEDGLNEGEDELESVHISEATRRKKNADAAKKKPLYDVYGDTGAKQELLPQYNDEKKEEGVTLGTSGEVDLVKRQQLEEVRKKLQAVKQEAYDLEAPVHLKPMADYYTTEEMTQFKKPERRRKKKATRKKENLAEIIAATTTASTPAAAASEGDHGSRATRAEGTMDQKLKQEKELRSQNYEKALARASEESKILYSADVDDDEDFYATLRQAKKAPALESVAAAVAASAMRRKAEEESVASTTTIIEYDDDDGDKDEGEEAEGRVSKGPLVISTTSEFVRNIHFEADERPAPVVKSEGITSTLRTVKAEKPQKEDTEMEDAEKEEKEEESEDEIEDANPLVGDEPLVSGSLAATLQFLKQRGSSMPFEAYAGRANDKVLSHKDDPAPNIRLEYLDEQGRPMTLKEAFRAQSYKFHGKKPGKNNQEKRQKRLEMDKKKLAAPTTDTPLMAVQALKEAQQKTGSAYVVLQTGSMSIAARAAESGGGGGGGASADAKGTKRKGQGAAGSEKRAKK